MKLNDLKELTKFDNLKSIETNWEQAREKRLELENKYKNFTGTIYSLGDIHSPYTRWDILKTFFQTIPNKSQNLFILQDVLTFDLFSPYMLEPAIEYNIQREIAQVKSFLDICNKFGQMIWIKSNHERRPTKLIQRCIRGHEEQAGALSLFMTFEDIFKGIENLTFANDPNCFIQIGDVIIAHLEPSSAAVKGRTAEWGISHFISMGIENFKVLFCGHTHKNALIPHLRRLGVEIGNFAKAFDYNRKGNIKWSKYGSTTRGFGVCEMKKGKVILQSVRTVILDFEEAL